MRSFSFLESFQPLFYAVTRQSTVTGMSCETAISRVVDRIESALQRGQQAVGVFLDISGAFDNINHDKALEAMRKREMPELFLNWYGHCLKNRTVTAEVAGASCTRSITRGTAQGGVLSPVIWNIVIEPLLLKMNEFADATGFADDTFSTLHPEAP